MNWLKHILTGIDGKTVDPARVLWIIGIITFLGFTAFQTWKTEHFEMVNFGIAYSGLLAAGAAGVMTFIDPDVTVLDGQG